MSRASAPLSTGVLCLRRTGGDEPTVDQLGKISGGVQIPVDHQSTRIAAEHLHSERQSRLDQPHREQILLDAK
jgi:hypothetical protein